MPSPIGQACFAAALRCRMVGPVSRGRTERVGLILTLALTARVARAAETDVTVTCLELSAEDSAQVEARVRASLLSAGLTPATLALSCEAAAAQTQVTGNGQQVTMRAERSQISLKDALLASAEAALSAWGSARGMVAPASPSPPLTAPAPEPEPTPPEVVNAPVAAPLTPPSRVPETRPAVRSSYWVFAGPRAELWHSGWALGGQLGVQRALASTFVAIRAGYLVNLPVSTQFSAHELQFGAELGYQPQGLLGLRGALGIGVSVFGATPAAGVSAQDGSDSSTLPGLSVELSRPVALGPLSLLPAVGVRAFTSARSVRVDGEEVLALPALAAQASLSLALKLGG